MEEHDLSPEAASLMKALIVSADAPEGESLAYDLLLRFAAGLATKPEADAVIEAMTRSAATRSKVLKIKSELKSREPLADSRPDSAVNRLVETIASVAGRMQEWLQQNSIGNVEQVLSTEAAYVRRLLRSIGESVQSSLSQPAFATTRGPEDEPLLDGHMPPGTSVQLYAELNKDGDLEVDILFRESVPGALNSLLGRTIFLQIVDPSGGAVPLAITTYKDAGWKVLIANFGAMTGMASGGLPARMFRVGTGEPSAQAVGQGTLYAKSETGDELIPFAVVEPARVEKGQFRVTLRLAEPYRTRHSAGQLELALMVGTVDVVLGYWPLVEWSDQPTTLHAPAPHFKEGFVTWGSLVRAKVLPHRPGMT